MRLLKVFSLVLLALTASSAFASETTMWLHEGNSIMLPECGGFMRTTLRRGQASLSFQHVRQCSNFDILAKNGRQVEFKSKKIPGRNNDRSGTFTLPRRIMSYGMNNVRIIVKSNSGKHSDIINLFFNNW